MNFKWLKYFLIYTAIATLTSPVAFSQVHYIFTLPSYTSIERVSWRDSIYRFPNFQKGRIIYSHEFEPDYDFTLNYNMYFEKMDYISVSGDTLNITNTREIKLVKVAGKEFFHDYKTGYYELILPLRVALASKNIFVLHDVQYSSSEKSQPLARARPGLPTSEVRGITTNYDRLYRKGYVYYFIDQNHNIVKASRNAILKLFPDHQQQIQEYLVENPTDFEARADLMSLITYCNQLTEDVKERKTVSKTLVVPANKSISSYRDGAYRFAEFQEAKITWSDHSDSRLPKVNYNFITGKFDMIEDDGDTVKLKRWAQANIINLDGTVFVRDLNKGFVEMRLQAPLGLVVQQKYVLVTDKALLEAERFVHQAKAYDVTANAPKADFDRLYQLEETYYFTDRQKHLYDANKLSLYKLMRPIKSKLITFLNENDISFDREADLLQVIGFCNQHVKRTTVSK